MQQRFLVIVGLCVLTIASAAGSASAGTVQPPSKPPIIKEPFTVLACNEKTTIGMEGCAEHQLLAADKRIDQEVSVLFSLLNQGASRQHLDQAQTTWLSYRQADCLSQSDAYQGGSEASVEFAACEVADDSARSADLLAFYKDLTQGESHAPAFP